MATKTKAPPAPVAEDDDDVELEELEETPAKASTKPEDDPNFYGVQQLRKDLLKLTGKDYQPREIRTLLRKLARDGSGTINREIIAGNKSRYSWGPEGRKHPEVQAVFKAVKGGAIEASKKEALDKLKADKAKKTAAAAAAGTAAPKGKATKVKAPVLDEPDDMDDFDDDDE